MNIALIAHDKKKEIMTQFCIAYCGILSKHKLYATSTTGKVVSEATGLPIHRHLSGSQGGVEQIKAKITYNEIDLLLYFKDQSFTAKEEAHFLQLINACDGQNVPVATNIATAEMLILGLNRGDLDWRELINPQSFSVT